MSHPQTIAAGANYFSNNLYVIRKPRLKCSQAETTKEILIFIVFEIGLTLNRYQKYFAKEQYMS